MLAFERKNQNSLGILVLLNLGARFGVERIRIYPRNTVMPSPSTPFQNDYLRAYELFTNDGLNLTSENTPIWRPLIAETDNQVAVIDVPLDPPRYVQHLRLRATSPVDFEIDEIEVFGKGFLCRGPSTCRTFSTLGNQPCGAPCAGWKRCWAIRVSPARRSVRARARTRRLLCTPAGCAASKTPRTFLFHWKIPGEEMGLAEYRKFPQKAGQTAHYRCCGPRVDGRGRDRRPDQLESL